MYCRDRLDCSAEDFGGVSAEHDSERNDTRPERVDFNIVADDRGQRNCSTEENDKDDQKVGNAPDNGRIEIGRPREPADVTELAAPTKPRTIPRIRLANVTMIVRPAPWRSWEPKPCRTSGIRLPIRSFTHHREREVLLRDFIVLAAGENSPNRAVELLTQCVLAFAQSNAGPFPENAAFDLRTDIAELVGALFLVLEELDEIGHFIADHRINATRHQIKFGALRCIVQHDLGCLVVAIGFQPIVLRRALLNTDPLAGHALRRRVGNRTLLGDETRNGVLVLACEGYLLLALFRHGHAGNDHVIFLGQQSWDDPPPSPAQ